MDKTYLAGIDIGTSGAKAIVFDLAGNPLSSAYNEYGSTYPRPAWVEQDADLIVERTMKSMREAVAQSGVGPGRIASVSLSAQRSCAIFLDDAGRIIRPMISWQDNRPVDEMAEIARAFPEADYYRSTGFPNSTTWILAKILWVRKNESETWKRTARIVQMHDYFLRALGAEDYFVDFNDAGFFGFFDSTACEWDRGMLGAFGIPERLLPVPRASATAAGLVSARGSERSGLAAGTRIAIGAGDQCAGSLGAGVVRRGTLSISMGTAGAVTALLESPYRDPNGRMMITNHSERGKWLLEGYQAAAASVFRWFKEELAGAETADAAARGLNAYDLICERASGSPAGAKGLVFLPYFASAATPRYNPDARGVLCGMTFAHDRACVARAFMEGITMDMRDMIVAIKAAGAGVDTVRLLGGPTKSGFWNQMQADIYGANVQTLKIGDATVLGAAIMGGVGAGTFASVEEGTKAMVRVDRNYEPNPANVRFYDEMYEAWLSVYEGMVGAGAFGRIAALQKKQG
jgi:xylulokinase